MPTFIYLLFLKTVPSTKLKMSTNRCDLSVVYRGHGVFKLKRRHVESVAASLGRGDLDITLASSASHLITAHKSVLIENCSYFKAALGTLPDLNKVKRITMEDVDGVNFQTLLDFFYTKEVTVSISTVASLVCTADRLGCQSALELCTAFLSSIMAQVKQCGVTCQNMFDLVLYALAASTSVVTCEVEGLTRVRTSCVEMIRLLTWQKGCRYLLSSHALPCLTYHSLHVLVSLLGPSSIRSPHTTNILPSLISWWMQQDEGERQTPAAFLLSLYHGSQTGSTHDTTKANQSLISCFLRSQGDSQRSSATDHSPCGRHVKVVMVGGMNPSDVPGRYADLVMYVMCDDGRCVVSPHQTHHLTSLSGGATSFCPQQFYLHAVCHHDDNLYVSGGMILRNAKFKVASVGTSAVVYRYSLSSGQWSQLASMRECREDHVMVVFHGRLYSIGGVSKVGQVLRGVESLDVVSVAQVWQEEAPMLHARSGHAAAVSGERILVAGGLGDHTLCTSHYLPVLSSVEVYDGVGWSLRQSLPRPLTHATLTPLGPGTTLYLVGGATRCRSVPGHGGCCDPRRCLVARGEVLRYSQELDHWLEVQRVVIPRYGHSTCQLGSALVVVGGVHSAGGVVVCAEVACEQTQEAEERKISYNKFINIDLPHKPWTGYKTISV